LKIAHERYIDAQRIACLHVEQHQGTGFIGGHNQRLGHLKIVAGISDGVRSGPRGDAPRDAFAGNHLRAGDEA
jgi:hypothetical protein